MKRKRLVERIEALEKHCHVSGYVDVTTLPRYNLPSHPYDQSQPDTPPLGVDSAIKFHTHNTPQVCDAGVPLSHCPHVEHLPLGSDNDLQDLVVKRPLREGEFRDKPSPEGEYEKQQLAKRYMYCCYCGKALVEKLYEAEA